MWFAEQRRQAHTGLWALFMMLSLVLVGASAQSKDDQSSVLLVGQAHGTETVTGGQPVTRTYLLTERWDRRYPGQGGHAHYRLVLPATSEPGPMGLLMDRVGNQAEIRVNGVVVRVLGSLGDARHDAGKFPQQVFLPRSLLHADRPNVLEVELTLQPMRAGGLSPVRYGPWEEIRSMYAAQSPWRQVAPMAYAVSLALMGGLAAALWWRQKDPVYGCFSLSAWCGVVRHLDRAWLDVPVPWPWWGGIVAACYAVHLALIIWFVLLVLGGEARRMGPAVLGALGLTLLLSTLAFSLHMPGLWTAGLSVLLAVALLTFAFVARVAYRERRRLAYLLLAAGALAIVAGAHDLWRVRMGQSTVTPPIFMPHAMFCFVVIMAGIVVERYSRSIQAYRRLNTELADRVSARERELSQAYESLQQQREAQVIGQERQRIMREIHDGIGAHLVGLLNMVARPAANPEVLQDQVQLALDEMRMAVDALQPSCTDLVTLLATLRYRLQPRLSSAGIDVRWEVPALPAAPIPAPQVMLHVQRILLEAFTNVLKHARATQITMRASWEDGPPSAIRLQLMDDGIGLPEDTQSAQPGERGQGLRNMAARAESIGAQLSVAAMPGGGTRVTLLWPVAAHP